MFHPNVWSVPRHISFYNVEKAQVHPEKAAQIHYIQAGGVTGHIMLLRMLLIYTTSHYRIRHQSFEIFWYTHHLFVPFLSLYTHSTGRFVRDSTKPISPLAGVEFWNHCLGYQSWRWEVVAGSLYWKGYIGKYVPSKRQKLPRSSAIHIVCLHIILHSSRLFRSYTEFRCNRNPSPQAKYEVQTGAVDLHPGPRSLQHPMAPLHHHFMSFWSIYRHSCATSWWLHLCPWWCSRLWPCTIKGPGWPRPHGYIWGRIAEWTGIA